MIAKLQRIFLLISLLSFSKQVHAAIGFEDAVFPELATSGRALAMGNAFICKVDDSSAVYYNPAGLGTVRHPHLHLSNFHLETNKGWSDMGLGGSVTDVSSNFAKSFSLDGTRELLVENPGKISHARFHMLPNFTARYFSFGFLLSKRQRATLGTEPGAQFEYASRLDYGPYMAINLSLFGGIFKIGASGTLLNRDEAIGTSDPNVTIDIKDSEMNRGSMALITAGTRLTLPIVFLPTFAATIHNAAAQNFSSRGGGIGPPDEIKQTIDVGFSLTPQVGKVVRIHLEANYKDIGQAYSNVSVVRRLVMGMELDVARRFFLRVGYGDGFGSAGLGMKTRKLEFDLTTYAVDTTSSEFRGAEDRRFVLSLSSGF